MNELRRQIARQARKPYKNEIRYDEFLVGVPQQDQLIDELVDLIEHEPKKGGFFGVNKNKHAEYVSDIFCVIQKLESSEI